MSTAESGPIEGTGDKFLDSLPEVSVRGLLGPLPETPDPEYAGKDPVLAALPSGARKYWEQKTTPEASQPAKEMDAVEPEPTWCVADFPEGEFGFVRQFKTLEGMVTFLDSIAGQPRIVVPFLGYPMRFTRPNAKGKRLMMLPGPYEAVAIREVHEGEQVKRIDRDLLDDEDLDFQENWWIGLPCLAEHTTPYYDGDEELNKQNAQTPSYPPNDQGEGDDDTESSDDNVPN